MTRPSTSAPKKAGRIATIALAAFAILGALPLVYFVSYAAMVRRERYMPTSKFRLSERPYGRVRIANWGDSRRTHADYLR